MTLPPIFALNSHGRDFAVGDIHGAFTALQAALDYIGFDPATDRLFSVGDLVDRGPESADVLIWLDKPWFHAILGNHDLMTCRAALGDPFPGIDYAAHWGAWLAALPADRQIAIGKRLRALPIVAEIETPAGTIGMIHADCPYDDWADIRSTDWDSIDDLDPTMKVSLWSSMRYAKLYTATIKNIRAVVHGHTTIPHVTVLGNVHYIDTGGWCAPAPGRFAFLDLHSLETSYGPGKPYRPPSRRSM
jgi:serine/threonine protein phosphatase 1